jgi:hypothetical protein
MKYEEEDDTCRVVKAFRLSVPRETRGRNLHNVECEHMLASPAKSRGNVLGDISSERASYYSLRSTKRFPKRTGMTEHSRF